MDPYKFNSWIRILISLCSIGAYILISLMLPLFVAVPDFETWYGIFFVAPYNDNKYVTWSKFEGHVCKNEKIYKDTSKSKHFAKDSRAVLCSSINFFKHYLLIGTSGDICHKTREILQQIDHSGGLSHDLEEVTTPMQRERTNRTAHNTLQLNEPLRAPTSCRDKTILKCVCELEILPWEKKQKLAVHNATFNDTLISPSEITNYLHNIFQQDNIDDEQLRNFFGTNNYEQIYYIIMNNIRTQKQMMNMY
ncbi:hypothetical protein POVCU2_0097620 [Plasmodium ovale curtisi]|uniref:Uncharacterized protein n=1 Tax=Plasmodium ovale curtisi TaxID=864141 RepID=A0A1A8WUW1_PLAOA|nr:hypothetical protein POVCU1_012400 [Plasmodium ovale curtisi]SBS95646.1 hypothetical protein POVCU2_0097620 [Plasmodium ovale curtisi]